MDLDWMITKEYTAGAFGFTVSVCEFRYARTLPARRCRGQRMRRRFRIPQSLDSVCSTSITGSNPCRAAYRAVEDQAQITGQLGYVHRASSCCCGGSATHRMGMESSVAIEEQFRAANQYCSSVPR